MQQLKIDSPATVVEGESYTVRLTVTNQSTKAGIPVEATLEIVIQVATAWTTLIPVTASMEAFGAGQTRTFDYPMDVPLGSGGESGQIIALVRDPAGVELARATELINIEAIMLLLYSCAYCTEKFATLDELEAHQRAEHPDMVEAAGGRIYYLCPYCEWGGWYRWDLYRHLWYHRPDIPKPEYYACHYCRSIFPTADQLMAHISSVHGLPAPTPTPEEAAFYLWDMSVTRAYVGQTCIIYLRIINYGGDTGEYNIQATIDGQTFTSTGKLTPADQGTLEFRFTPTRAGTYEILANGFTGSFEVKVQPGMIQITGFSVPGSAKERTAVTAVVTYQVTGVVPGATATLYATNEFVDRLATSSVNLTPGTHTLTLTFTAWRGTILMNVYCYIEYYDGEYIRHAYSGVVRISITNLVY